MSKKVELYVDTFIEIINDIIETAIDHGGDSGGPYFSDTEKLEKEMRLLIKWAHLDEYLVCDNGGYLFYARDYEVKNNGK